MDGYSARPSAQVKATRQAAARDGVPVLTADGRLKPAAACVHIGSAPRSLLRRCSGVPAGMHTLESHQSHNLITCTVASGLQHALLEQAQRHWALLCCDGGGSVTHAAHGPSRREAMCLLSEAQDTLWQAVMELTCVHNLIMIKACARCRVDAGRLAVAHPKLAPDVATALDIPALEHVVVEVLDSFGVSGDNQLQSIQVSACDACGVPALARDASGALALRPVTFRLCQVASAHVCLCDVAALGVCRASPWQRLVSGSSCHRSWQQCLMCCAPPLTLCRHCSPCLSKRWDMHHDRLMFCPITRIPHTSCLP